MLQKGSTEEETAPAQPKKMKYEPQLPTLIDPSASKTKKIAPIIRALSTPPKTAFDDNTFNTVPIPNCAILAYPNEHSEKEIDNARVRVIRLTMDSLITKCGDRPTELELIHLAKSIATQYSILRDDPGLPVRDNYVSNMGSAHTQ